VKKKFGGLSLIDPREAEIALLSKWIVYSFLPGKSNLQTIIRHKVSLMHPSRTTKWPRDPLWGLVTNHTSTLGSRVWSRIQLAWSRMCRHIREGRPLCAADTESVPLWWNNQYKVGDYNISHAQALEFYNKGLCTIGDLWDLERKQFKRLDTLQCEFSLNHEKIQKLAHLIVDLDVQHRFYLETPNSALFVDSWVGGFTNDDEDHPAFLYRTQAEWDPPSLHLTDTLRNLPPFVDIFIVGPKSPNLIRSQDADLRDRIKQWGGIFRQVRVVEVRKNNNKNGTLMYCGRPGRISGPDPAHWQWQDGSPFFQFSVKKGREMLSNRSQLKKPIAEKWRRERQVGFPMRWEDPWNP
jgi:hypothetical protein